MILGFRSKGQTEHRIHWAHLCNQTVRQRRAADGAHAPSCTCVHNQVGSNQQYAGGLGWCAFDYNTHADFGPADIGGEWNTTAAGACSSSVRAGTAPMVATISDLTPTLSISAGMTDTTDINAGVSTSVMT